MRISMRGCSRLAACCDRADERAGVGDRSRRVGVRRRPCVESPAAVAESTRRALDGRDATRRRHGRRSCGVRSAGPAADVAPRARSLARPGRASSPRPSDASRASVLLGRLRALPASRDPRGRCPAPGVGALPQLSPSCRLAGRAGCCGRPGGASLRRSRPTPPTMARARCGALGSAGARWPMDGVCDVPAARRRDQPGSYPSRTTARAPRADDGLGMRLACSA
jgi:hypothetical protein